MASIIRRKYHKMQDFPALIGVMSKKNEYLNELHEITKDLLENLEVEKLLIKIMTYLSEMFNTPDTHIYLVDESKKLLKVSYGLGYNARLIGYTLNLGEGLAGKAAELGKPLFVEDYQNWPHRVRDEVCRDLKTVVCIPLKYQEEVIGVIGIDYYQNTRSFSSEDILIFSRFAELASIALVNARIHYSLVESERVLQKKNEELSATYEELLAAEGELRDQYQQLIIREDEINRQNIVLLSLQKTALGLMKRLEVNEVLNEIANSAITLFNTRNIWIDLVDKEQELFLRVVGKGFFEADKNVSTRFNEGIVGQTLKNEQVMVVEDYSIWEHRLSNNNYDNLHAMVAAPLKSGDDIIGVFGLVFDDNISKFNSDDIFLLTRFAELASIALDNAKNISLYKQSEANKDLLLNAIPDVLFKLSRNGIIVECRSGREKLRTDPENFIGKSVFETLPKELANIIINCIDEALKTGEVICFENQLSALGSILHYEARIVPANQNEVLAIVRNVTEKHVMEMQLKHLSMHDSLTGLYNRTFFEEKLKNLQADGHGFVGLIICDVDGLKIINDTLGHWAGDVILKTVAQILAFTLNNEDIIARIGGDEFVVILSGSSQPDIEKIIKNIQDSIAGYNSSNSSIPISLSIGFAVRNNSNVDLIELFKEADNNMYREKLHRQKSARNAVVQGLIKALEERDFITEGHGDRMQQLMETFAVALKLPQQNIADLKLLARFHDIGKVGIPDNILFKPGKLTDAEFEIMKQHSEIGYRIAKATPDLEPISDWILKHHEWWDGKGYPLGIQEESIPLACRMLSIVDAFDAMTSDRPYRKAFNKDDAIAELKRCSGYQFDPRLTAVFCKLIK